MSNKVIKPVSFNITRPDDAEMLAHVKRRNFSGYVKKLIWADIKRQEELKRQKGPVTEPKAEIKPTLEQLVERIKLAGKDINKGTDSGTDSGSN
jgi:hypothetical protein